LKNSRFPKMLLNTGAIILVLVLLLSTLLVACSKPTTTVVTSTATQSVTSTAGVTTTATATATTTATTVVKPITLIYTSHNNGTGFWAKNVIGPYFREIEKRTNGRVLIEEHWNGELVSLPDAYDAMLKGTVDMAEWFPSMLQGRFPMEDVVSFTQVSTNRPARVLYETAQLYPKMVEPYNDGKILLRNVGYSVGMFTTKKQIKDLAGSAGMKIGPVGKWSSALIQAYGWVPTPVPPQESTSALQTGVQEGSGASWYLLWEFGWGSIMKYATMPIACDEMLVDLSMNKNKWNALPKDVQDIINGLQEWVIDLQDAAVVKNAMTSPDKARKEFKIETYTLPQSEIDKMASISANVRAEYVKSLKAAGLPDQAFVDKYLEISKKYADPQYAPK
jgi:TRAP-type C4-dicarboxylate transport system substrate-binding protein